MSRRVLVAVVAAAVLCTLSLSVRGAAQADGPSTLVAHEWGTFTSIAAPDGTALRWQPWSAEQDLPCFVETGPVREVKIGSSGTVRMETPVLYFYSPTAVRLSVGVGFKQGLITEWFPHATVTPSGFMDVMQPSLRGLANWTDVRVTPGLAETYPTDGMASHYYAARATDATPLTAAGGREKFLFYRGVAGFEPSIAAIVEPAGRGVSVTTSGASPLGAVILFENRAGVISYQLKHFEGRTGHFTRTATASTMADLGRDLERVLVDQGLFEKEAAAMVATWRDSWFEPGARLIYIVPKPFVEDVLPMTITPAPASLTRVFVGRVELITPEDLALVTRAITSRDTATLTRGGRFLQTMLNRLALDTPSLQPEIAAAMAPIYKTPSPRRPCDE